MNSLNVEKHLCHDVSRTGLAQELTYWFQMLTTKMEYLCPNFTLYVIVSSVVIVVVALEPWQMSLTCIIQVRLIFNGSKATTTITTELTLT